jgi:hypothetical protein
MPLFFNSRNADFLARNTTAFEQSRVAVGEPYDVAVGEYLCAFSPFFSCLEIGGGANGNQLGTAICSFIARNFSQPTPTEREP